MANLETTRKNALKFQDQYKEEKDAVDRKLLRIIGITTKVRAYDEFQDVQAQVSLLAGDAEKIIVNKDISAQLEFTELSQDLKQKLDDIYMVLPEEIDKINTLLTEVYNVKSALEYEKARADYIACTASLKEDYAYMDSLVLLKKPDFSLSANLSDNAQIAVEAHDDVIKALALTEEDVKDIKKAAPS